MPELQYSNQHCIICCPFTVQALQLCLADYAGAICFSDMSGELGSQSAHPGPMSMTDQDVDDWNESIDRSDAIARAEALKDGGSLLSTLKMLEDQRIWRKKGDWHEGYR